MIEGEIRKSGSVPLMQARPFFELSVMGFSVSGSSVRVHLDGGA